MKTKTNNTKSVNFNGLKGSVTTLNKKVDISDISSEDMEILRNEGDPSLLSDSVKRKLYQKMIVDGVEKLVEVSSSNTYVISGGTGGGIGGGTGGSGGVITVPSYNTSDFEDGNIPVDAGNLGITTLTPNDVVYLPTIGQIGEGSSYYILNKGPYTLQVYHGMHK